MHVSVVIFVLFCLVLVFLNEVCANLSSEPINPSAHTACAGFSRLTKLAALYILQISNDQLHFIKYPLIGPHEACLFAAGTVARLMTARVSKPKLGSVTQKTPNYRLIKKPPRRESSSGHRSPRKDRLKF